jgi:hypothetical protein
MPAANSIANQDIVENSGTASCPPRRILPTGRKIRTRQNNTKMLPPNMNNQSKAPIDHHLAPSKAPLAASGAIKTPITNSRIRPAATQNTG